MMDDGLFDRFGIEEVFGMHNYPGMPIGQFAIRPGPMMASSDTITVDIEGVGGHAARPHFAVDTVLVGAQIVNQLQSVVSRNVDPLHAAVISICMFQAGHANNVIPQHAKLRGTARSLSPKVQDLLQKRVREVVEGTARAYGAKAELTYTTGYPVLVNEERKTAFAASVARESLARTRSTPSGAADGGRGFRLHAAGATGRVHLHWQRQQRAAAQPGIRLQRRSDPGRDVLLGTSRRNRTRGLKLLPLLRHFHAVFGGKLRRDDLRFEVHAGAWPLASRAMKQLRSHLFQHLALTDLTSRCFRVTARAVRRLQFLPPHPLEIEI